MACQRCQSKRVALINAKCADLCHFECDADGVERNDYPPELDSLATYKYIRIEICLDCGTVQGKFPISRETVREACGLPPEGDDEES